MYMLSSFLPAPARADSRSQRLLIIKSLFKKERIERERDRVRETSEENRETTWLPAKQPENQTLGWGRRKGGDKENRRYRERMGERESVRERKREWMLTITQTQSRGFILHRQRNTNRKHIFSSPGPERDKKSNLYSIPPQSRLPCSSACIFVNTASSEWLNLPRTNAGWRQWRGDGMGRLGRRGQARSVQAKPQFLLCPLTWNILPPKSRWMWKWILTMKKTQAF